jgi:hypothetical protein
LIRFACGGDAALADRMFTMPLDARDHRVNLGAQRFRETAVDVASHVGAHNAPLGLTPQHPTRHASSYVRQIARKTDAQSAQGQAYEAYG